MSVLEDLVRALRLSEPDIVAGRVEQLGVLIGDDPDEGLDAEAIRVLSAWKLGAHAWKQPRLPCPEDLRSRAAYDWMVRGMDVDYVAIADTAGVTVSVARAKMAKLLGARLVYADGTTSKAADAALQAGIARRVKKAAPKAQQGPAAPRPAPPKPPEAN